MKSVDSTWNDCSNRHREENRGVPLGDTGGSPSFLDDHAQLAADSGKRPDGALELLARVGG
jgi:hypothetical protein